MPRLSEATAPTERNTLLENTAYSVSCLRCLQVWFPVLSICSNFSFIFCFFCEMICCMYHLVLGHQVRTLTYATTLPSSCILNFVKTQTMRLCFQSHPLYVVSFTHNLPTNNSPQTTYENFFYDIISFYDLPRILFLICQDYYFSWHFFIRICLECYAPFFVTLL